MNYYYPHDQFLYSLAMLVVGVITGIFYDLFRIKRKLFGSNNLILFFDDVFFTVAAVMFYLISVFVFNNGIVRWYSGVLCLIGLYAYLHTLSVLFTYIMFYFINVVHKILRIVVDVFLIPLKCIINFLKKPYYLIFRYFYRRKLFHTIICDGWLK